MNSEKIVYLIGAGASAGRLPLGNSLSQALIKLATEDPEFKVESDIRQAIYWLGKKSHDWLVDDVAHQLYKSFTSSDTARAEYRKLKAALSVALLYWQLNNTPERRYSRFFHEFPNQDGGQGIKLPPIKVITWNYDMQWELAYSAYCNTSLGSILSAPHLQVIPNADIPSFDLQYSLDESRFALVKLNGTAGFLQSAPEAPLSTFASDKIEVLRQKKVDFLTRVYRYGTDTNHSTEAWLSFAWEKNARALRIREIAKSLISQATTVVIIGYSFPKSNQEVDNYIFSGLTDSPRMVINMPAPADVEQLHPKLHKINPKFYSKLEPVYNTDYFPNYSS